MDSYQAFTFPAGTSVFYAGDGSAYRNPGGGVITVDTTKTASSVLTGLGFTALGGTTLMNSPLNTYQNALALRVSQLPSWLQPPPNASLQLLAAIASGLTQVPTIVQGLSVLSISPPSLWSTQSAQSAATAFLAWLGLPTNFPINTAGSIAPSPPPSVIVCPSGNAYFPSAAGQIDVESGDVSYLQGLGWSTTTTRLAP